MQIFNQQPQLFASFAAVTMIAYSTTTTFTNTITVVEARLGDNSHLEDRHISHHLNEMSELFYDDENSPSESESADYDYEYDLLDPVYEEPLIQLTLYENSSDEDLQEDSNSLSVDEEPYIYSTLYENSSDEDLEEDINSLVDYRAGGDAGRKDGDMDEVPATAKLSNLIEIESMDDSSDDGNSTDIATDDFPSESWTSADDNTTDNFLSASSADDNDSGYFYWPSTDDNSTEAPSITEAPLDAVVSEPVVSDVSDDANSTDAPSTIEDPLNAMVTDPLLFDISDDNNSTDAPSTIEAPFDAALSDQVVPDISDDDNSTETPSTIEAPFDAVVSDPVVPDVSINTNSTDAPSTTEAPMNTVVSDPEVPDVTTNNNMNSRMDVNGQESTSDNSANYSAAIISSIVPCVFGMVIATLSLY